MPVYRAGHTYGMSGAVVILSCVASKYGDDFTFSHNPWPFRDENTPAYLELFAYIFPKKPAQIDCL